MGCGNRAGIGFFIFYYLMVPLIFLNLFIAIILEGFTETSTKINDLIPEEHLEGFRDCWAKFDKNVRRFLVNRFEGHWVHQDRRLARASLHDR